jgi:hypothetical protein
LFGLLFAIAATSMFVIYITSSGSSAEVGTTSAGAVRAFSGGKFEASGVVKVPGTDGILFVDDGQTNRVFWMQLGGDGSQAGPVKPVELGVTIEDPEGITTDGSYFYVVGSQSKSQAGNQPGIARFKFDTASQRAEQVETISDLKRLLVENVAELRGMAGVKAKDDGINIEGLAFDTAGNRLLVGLRSPVVDGHALVIPLKLRDARGPFSLDNIDTGEMKSLKLPLSGLGIRGIEYDERAKTFHIISGATESQDRVEFKLWEWGGEAGQGALREVTTFDRKLKPEGVARVSAGESDFTFIVFDTSQYMVMR